MLPLTLFLLTDMTIVLVVTENGYSVNDWRVQSKNKQLFLPK